MRDARDARIQPIWIVLQVRHTFQQYLATMGAKKNVAFNAFAFKSSQSTYKRFFSIATSRTK